MSKRAEARGRRMRGSGRRTRHELCSCGSGKKFRHCCARYESPGRKRPNERDAPTTRLLYLALAVTIIGGIALVLRELDRRQEEAREPTRVWSEEHQHWHTAGGEEPGGRALVPPPGPAPPGKVWSPEHAHWHNADAPDKEP